MHISKGNGGAAPAILGLGLEGVVYKQDASTNAATDDSVCCTVCQKQLPCSCCVPWNARESKQQPQGTGCQVLLPAEC